MYTLLFYLPIVSVFLIVGARLREMGTNRGVIKGVIRENLTLRLFLLVGTTIAFLAILEYCFLRHWISWVAFAVGWACAIVSFALRRRAIAALGKFWSLHVEIRAEHEFVRSGPFRFVRHPAYFSMILELLALTVICQAWFTMLAIPLLFVPVLLRRIALEETALIEKFGPSYQEYRRTTPALFPRPW
jgi:protein-S-isoprenylcysteine O-methyltransferase Ste14